MLGVTISSLTPLLADPPKPAPPATNAAPASPAKPVAPPPPVPPPADFDRYGRIWVPSDDAAHPLKLNLSFPGVGELRIPNQDEITMREKLEQLATLSDDQIRTKLNEWPPYSKMKLGDEGQLLTRIQQFKDLRSQVAAKKAHELGLTLTPDQQTRFEKEYWDKRLQMDRDLAKQFQPALKARDQQMREELFREFSSSGTVVPAPPGAKPPTPPATPTPAPIAQAKPVPPAAAPAPAPTGPGPAPTVGKAPAH